MSGLWLPSTTVLISPNTSLHDYVLFLNTATPAYKINGIQQSSLPAPGVWHTVDFTPSGVPVDAVALLIAGILIITDGSGSNDTSIAMCFQSPGAGNDPAHYEMQACAVLATGGARTNAGAIVPCVNGCIDYSWLRGNSNGEWPTGPIPAYPAGAAYGFNLNVQAAYMP